MQWMIWFVGNVTQLQKAVSELRSPTAKYFVTNWGNSLWITNCHLISRNVWISALICLCTCPMFRWVCQIPCTPTSLTAWHTGYNVIRRDPEQYVMTLVDGRGYSTGGADRYDWGSALCVHTVSWLDVRGVCLRCVTPSKDFVKVVVF